MTFKQALDRARFILAWCSCYSDDGKELFEITKADVAMLVYRDDVVFKYNDKTKVLVLGKGV